MATKREIRIETMKGLYLFEIYGNCDFQMEQVFSTSESIGLFQNVIKDLEKIDKSINENLYNYSFSRLSYVDKSILRIATYELLFTDTPTSVIINEAVEITKKFSDLDDQKQHKFNNSLLDSIAKVREK
ncbi:transcription antitermination factor NusB [Acholeplasma sp. OttesenSCG-928-E16]|nr:transcription antitermination factor NusB [Acholeplasma sp. OttesenSCG-928-E16]